MWGFSDTDKPRSMQLVTATGLWSRFCEVHPLSHVHFPTYSVLRATLLLPWFMLDTGSISIKRFELAADEEWCKCASSFLGYSSDELKAQHGAKAERKQKILLVLPLVLICLVSNARKPRDSKEGDFEALYSICFCGSHHLDSVDWTLTALVNDSWLWIWWGQMKRLFLMLSGNTRYQ